MSACPQCGTPARPTDKFCNACGTPIGRSSAPGVPGLGGAPLPVGSPFVAPTPPPPFPAQAGGGGFPGGQQGRAQGARCQMGHEIAPGTSYCAQGHPIALDQMQFANDAYPPAPQYGALQPPPYASPGMAAPAPPPGFPMGQPPPPAFPQAVAPPPFVAPMPQPAPYPGNELGHDPTPPKILRGFLVAYGSNPSGDFWPLTGGRSLVGRFGSADRIDIALQDPTISSRHAAMLVDPGSGAVAVEDTGSTNGTFVNDEHIGFNGRRELRDGDRVRFGAYVAIVKVIGRV
jgi:hypothetical protein